MAKNKSRRSKSRRGARPHPATAGGDTAADSRSKDEEEKSPAAFLRQKIPSGASVRETVESVVIAFVLAFLFRTFEAEAFVIPTGSMAPTLMGRHKDLVCPNCGYPYQVSASDEVDESGRPKGENRWEQEDNWVEGCTCPMCRYPLDMGPGNPHKKYPSYNGDRIIVGKFAYLFHDPERWDVAVFKFPGKAQKNYIKRLVGKPGETIRIRHGDLFVKGPGEEDFSIARKQSPDKILAMLQPVYDNDYALPEWPARWQPVASADGGSGGAWTASEDLRSFHTDGAVEGENWLRYKHIVPTYEQWQTLEEKDEQPADSDPQLITNFTAYNTSRSRSEMRNSRAPTPQHLGTCWVGDLALMCTMEVDSEEGEAVFELVEGGWRFQCRIDLATGQATLSMHAPDNVDLQIEDFLPSDFHPTAETGVRGPGKYKIIFSNVDDQLRLWVDGSAVQFDTQTSYPPLGNTEYRGEDLAPVGIGSVEAALRLSHLKVYRDIYYMNSSELNQPVPDEFELAKDQFLVLGDNSAKSLDSRLWGKEHYVSRELLIGKAFFIYWPHSWNKVPWVNMPCPFFPNFERMGFVE